MYLFGMGTGKLTKGEIAARKRAAKSEGCTFIHADLPGEGWRHWFSGPNRGEPFDRSMAVRVMRAIGDGE